MTCQTGEITALGHPVWSGISWSVRPQTVELANNTLHSCVTAMVQDVQTQTVADYKAFIQVVEGLGNRTTQTSWTQFWTTINSSYQTGRALVANVEQLNVKLSDDSSSTHNLA
jgi:hypothetical protein